MIILLCFSSEIKPLINYRRRNDFNLTPNDNAVFDYLRLDRRNSNFNSFFNEIKQIEPQHSLNLNYQIPQFNQLINFGRWIKSIATQILTWHLVLKV